MDKGNNPPDPHLHHFDFCPWLFAEEASQRQKDDQANWQASLVASGLVALGSDCFISPLAGVFPTRLVMGDRCYIAAYVYLTDEVRLGMDCTVNPFASLRGKITAGDGVRIGGHSVLLGFNHGFEDLDIPIHEQDLTSQGITIGSDVWIGSSVTVVDGVTIGNHSVVAAGAVVTRDVPEYSIVGGNPARVLRNRLDGKISDLAHRSIGLRLKEFDRLAREEWEQVLEGYLANDTQGDYYVNQPESGPSVRAWCDAVEIAAMFGGLLPATSEDQLVKQLQSFQDAASGLFPEPWSPPGAFGDGPDPLSDDLARYNILAVGYALELLGSHPAYPISVVETMTSTQLYRLLDRLPWETNAWDCGDWIDSYGTALYFNARYFGSKQTPEPVLGWLLTHADRFNGMWAQPRHEDGWLQPVNGFYRLTRGTYAQFGLPVPYPQAALDTLLAHAQDPSFFRRDQGNACNVLDVIHGLWLCGLQTDYRAAEAKEWATRQLERALDKWVKHRGFSFELEWGDISHSQPSLQGTEMWLSIIFLLAEVCGQSHRLSYRPRGVHRLEPAWPYWRWSRSGSEK